MIGAQSYVALAARCGFIQRISTPQRNQLKRDRGDALRPPPDGYNLLDDSLLLNLRPLLRRYDFGQSRLALQLSVRLRSLFLTIGER